jgi:hypothetical protein
MPIELRKQSQRRADLGPDSVVDAFFTTSALLGVVLTVLLFLFGVFFFWST